ncbi:MAG TPA: GNAT family protein [Phycisphaerae bacterium]|nr:GNAT family protein [Phycisphaerae bacterium]
MQPTLYTPRLCLRPLTLADAKRVQHLAGDRRVAATTARIPHPYPDGAAEAWIESLPALAEKGTEFGVTLAGTRTPGRENDPTETGYLIGCVGLYTHGDPAHARALLGYWIGVPYWNKGFATEAANAVLGYGFTRRGFNRIGAEHYVHNPASGRVMEKLGMTREGVLRQYHQKWDHFVDVVSYSILQEEWRVRRYSGLRGRRGVPAEVAACV